MDVRLTKQLAELTAAGDELHIIDLQSAGSTEVAPVKASWWTVNPGSATEVDRHDAHEIWIISTGGGAFTCGTGTVQVGAGDLLRIPPRSPHRIVNDRTELLTVYSLWWD